mgnify:CR=1 FL=1
MDTLSPVMIIIMLLAFSVLGLVIIIVRNSESNSATTHLRDVQLKLAELQGAGLSERISGIQNGLAELRGAALTEQLSNIQSGLAGLREHLEARQRIELQTAESVRRLETVIAGTQSKGTAGENILEAIFAQLPPDWQVRNLRVGNKVVEFGLRLPNKLVLPIDSKWAATNLLEEFLACDDISEQKRLKAQIEKTVLSKAQEVTKYVDPNVTVPFGIAVVPDAVYDLSCGIQVEVFRLNVVLISYSMFVPYLLLVFQTALKASQSIDTQRLNAYLQAVEKDIEQLQSELDGRFARAITMLDNSKNDMSTYVSKIKGGLTSLQISAPENVTELIPPPVTE